MFESDRTCCVCADHRVRQAVQVHHIDGDPGNNAFENLAVLCLQHHHEATVGPGLGRGLSPTLIRQYRDVWYANVRKRRQAAVAHAMSPDRREDGLHDALLEAVACHEVRKLGAALQTSTRDSWKEAAALLGRLSAYADFRYGHRLRAELLDVLYTVSGRTRFEMPTDVARMIGQLTTEALPIVSLVRQTTEELSTEGMQLLSSATAIGFSLAYDGIKYLQNAAVVAAGSGILWTVLRHARLNNHAVLESAALERFERLKGVALERAFDAAWQQIEFDRLDSLALEDRDAPEFPAPPQRGLQPPN
ncbi:MAG TPA: HNH endonuclease signature motif containing protein [Gemmatimonadaceae bacterium]|nr:HNH endonuclease signature motif containing protein [Gemmatimonadaceae bacterium]